MKCPKCDTTILNHVNKCPNCGAFISIDDDLNIDLPSMKKEVVEEVYNDPSNPDNNEIQNEYNSEIKVQESEINTPITKEEVASVIDDYDDKLAAIDKEIEKVQASDEIENTAHYQSEDLNPPEDNEVSSPTVNDILEYEAVLPEDQIKKDNLRIKKNYLLICGAIAVLVIALGIFAISTFRKNNANYDYKSELSKSLDRYYNTNGEAYEALTKVLEHVYREQNKLDSAREETYQRIDTWIKEYVSVDLPTAAEFASTTTKYKTLVDNLYNKVEVNKIRLLEEYKYKEYSSKIDTISQDSKIYYRALDAFNKSDYNEAFAQFNRIVPTNSYYEKAKNYKTKIINTVISFIKKDITLLEEKIEDKDAAEQLQTYKHIVSIIQGYDQTYDNLGLRNNDIYQGYLTVYRNKVSELSS